MVLTDGWQKAVCALVRKADVGGFAVFDSVDALYEDHCNEICHGIEVMAKEWDGLTYEDISLICADVLGGFRPSYKQRSDLAKSICSRLGIALEEAVCSG